MKSQKTSFTRHLPIGESVNTFIMCSTNQLYRPEATDHCAQPKVGAQFSQQSVTQRPYSGCQRESFVKKYFGDGTGRDRYIVTGSGSVAFQDKTPDRFFAESLR